MSTFLCRECRQTRRHSVTCSRRTLAGRHSVSAADEVAPDYMSGGGTAYAAYLEEAAQHAPTRYEAMADSYAETPVQPHEFKVDAEVEKRSYEADAYTPPPVYDYSSYDSGPSSSSYDSGSGYSE